METLSPGYSQATYPDFVQVAAHPSLVFALARLYGHEISHRARTAPRVLDIGCNRGAQLRWIARTMPSSRCLGLDALPRAIAEARAKDNSSNLSFEEADLTTWDPGEQRFDLVIAYGMLSWIPDSAREALLRLIARVLAPGGVALVCWMALPGSMATEALGQLLRLEQGRLPDVDTPAESIGRGAAEALRRLGVGINPALAGPHMARALRSSQGQKPGQLTADELNPDRRAFYLLETLDAATQSGLAYMGDASLWPDWISGGPAEIAPALDGLPHLVALQYRDYLLEVGFRRSLFVPAQEGKAVRSEPDPASALSLHATAIKPKVGGVPSMTDPPGEDGEALLPVIQSMKQPVTLSKLVSRSNLPSVKDKSRWGLAALRLAANNRILLSLGPAPR